MGQTDNGEPAGIVFAEKDAEPVGAVGIRYGNPPGTYGNFVVPSVGRNKTEGIGFPYGRKINFPKQDTVLVDAGFFLSAVSSSFI